MHLNGIFYTASPFQNVLAQFGLEIQHLRQPSRVSNYPWLPVRGKFSRQSLAANPSVYLTSSAWLNV